MSAKVAFLERSVTLEEQKPKTALNSNAIMMHNNTRSVFLVNENRVHKNPFNHRLTDWRPDRGIRRRQIGRQGGSKSTEKSQGWYEN